MSKSHSPREVVRNLTSLSSLALTIDSTAVQPVGCLKCQPAQRLLDSLPFSGTLKTHPSWSVARFGPL